MISTILRFVVKSIDERFMAAVVVLLLAPCGSGAAQEFTFPVAVERGTTSLCGGDQITISEVRGTSQRLEPGNVYQVKGQYRLLTHQQADLTAFVQMANGSAPLVYTQQTQSVNQGDGDFTLVLPYAQTGTPQIAFQEGGRNSGSVEMITEEFPFLIEHGLEASRLSARDRIDVAEIRSSSKAMLPGTSLKITGTFGLDSQGEAKLVARLIHPGGAADEGQAIVIDRGNSQFTLVLRVSGPGTLQLLFLPNGSGGEALGGIQVRLGKLRAGPSTLPSFLPVTPNAPRILYFMTSRGNSQFGYGPSDSFTGQQVTMSFAMGTAELTEPVPTKFPYTVDFKTGLTLFPEHDSITIDKVEGTNKRITIGGWYKISGSYSFKSAQWAYFAAYVTSPDTDGDPVRDLPQQAVKLFPGGGRYSLILPVRIRGWPHIAIYPLGEGDPKVETRYFGTGDTVLYKYDQKPAPVD
jgi:hypothetical protein